jgi:hypothetical protein
MTGQMSVKDITGTARAAFPGDVTIGNLENFWSRRPWRERSADRGPQSDEGHRPGGECHLEPE